MPKSEFIESWFVEGFLKDFRLMMGKCRQQQTLIEISSVNTVTKAYTSSLDKNYFLKFHNTKRDPKIHPSTSTFHLKFITTSQYASTLCYLKCSACQRQKNRTLGWIWKRLERLSVHFSLTSFSSPPHLQRINISNNNWLDSQRLQTSPKNLQDKPGTMYRASRSLTPFMTA